MFIIDSKDTIMVFGKYKGESVDYILDNDPSYLRWVYENVDWVEIKEPIIEQVISLCELDSDSYTYKPPMIDDGWGDDGDWIPF